MRQVKHKRYFTVVFLIVLSCASVLLTSRSTGATTSLSPSDQPVFNINFCKIQSQDSTLYVPKIFNLGTRIPSGSGWYAYGKRLCPYFIVDLKVATYSNSYLDQNDEWVPEGFYVVASPYDLPSSAGKGLIPTTEEDCKRFSVSTTFYTKKQGETEFKLGPAYKSVGSWSASGKCTLEPSGKHQLGVEPSGHGWDTYRIVTGTKLRSTYQEVEIYFLPTDPD